MLGLLKRKRMVKDINRENLIKNVLDYNLICFSAYGISIKYPDTWSIFINPSKPFLYHDGQVKIDRSFDKDMDDREISLMLRWAKLDKKICIDDYVHEIKQQFILKQRKNKRDFFEISSINEISSLPYKAYLIETNIAASQAIYRTDKEVIFSSLEIAVYSEHSHRLIFAALSARKDYFDDIRPMVLKILMSLTCD